MGDGSHHVDDNALGEVIKLADPQGSIDLNAATILRKMLEWPQGEGMVKTCILHQGVTGKILFALNPLK